MKIVGKPSPFNKLVGLQNITLSIALFAGGSPLHVSTISIPISFNLKSRLLSQISSKAILENKNQLSSSVRNLHRWSCLLATPIYLAINSNLVIIMTPLPFSLVAHHSNISISHFLRPKHHPRLVNNSCHVNSCEFSSIACLHHLQCSSLSGSLAHFS